MHKLVKDIPTEKIRVIITGSTGMVGEGVLHECLLSPEVESVLVINRKPCGKVDPKLTEILHNDFQDISPIENKLNGYNACFFCLGISSIGMREAEFATITYTLTMHVATVLQRHNEGMSFSYISGAGTDSSAKGRVMWARVKGKTENDLMKLSFRQVFAFRPGFMKPTKGLKNTLKFYRYFGWLYYVGRLFYKKGFCTLKEVGQAMIHSYYLPDERRIFDVKDIIELAKSSKAKSR